MSAAQKLRDLLARRTTYHIPACHDALSARMTRDAGLPMSFVSGAAVAATRLGVPDIGLVSFGEALDQLRNICAAVPGYPLLADGDTGYGNAMNVRRTVIEFARAGAAAVMIEDQASPKRCGHFDGKQVVSFEEARMKLRAAAEAKKEGDILILARTDARAVEGLQSAIDRCRMFEDEGADIIFMEAPLSEEEMRKFCQAVKAPAMANMVPGGKTPLLPRDALDALGFRIVVYHPLILATVAALREALKGMKDPAYRSNLPLAELGDLKHVTGLAALEAIEARYRS
jgi:2-methylisocitrate lyase-like PEP mutase family enzyme